MERSPVLPLAEHTIFLWTLILTAAYCNGKARLNVTNLGCLNDYDSEMFCFWRRPDPSTNCSHDFRLVYERHEVRRILRPEGCTPENVASDDPVSYTDCICYIEVEFFGSPVFYRIELQSHGVSVENITVYPAHTVKPKPPVNVTIHQDDDMTVTVFWDTAYLHYNLDRLDYELQITSKQEPTEVKKIISDQEEFSYKFQKGIFRRGQDYEIKVRSRPSGKLYQGVWSEWSPAADWHNDYETSSLDIIRKVIPASAPVIFIAILLAYAACLYFKKRWQKDIPDPSKSHLARTMLHTSQVQMLNTDMKNNLLFNKMKPKNTICFDELLEIVGDNLKREDLLRSPISPRERLIVTLRFLATGCSYMSLQFVFRIGKSTISGIVADTCRVLWEALKDKVMPVCDQARWLEVAELFWQRTNFPNCVGAIDGKHIRLVMPPGSGSKFFNYKKYFSLVLMAVADSNYNFLCVDVGSYGSSSDSAVFHHSDFGTRFRQDQLHLPDPRPLPGTNEPCMPMVFVADEAFGISENLMRPYPQRGLDQKKRVFNYRLSRARRMVECTFGILANKWRVLHTPIHLKVENAIAAVKATCVLHNFVRARDGFNFDELEHRLSNVSGTGPRGSISAFSVRDKFANYFVSPAGELSWQYNVI